MGEAGDAGDIDTAAYCDDHESPQVWDEATASCAVFVDCEDNETGEPNLWDIWDYCATGSFDDVLAARGVT